MGQPISWRMTLYPRYLTIVPLFHCNGWCHTWMMPALGGTVVCCRDVTAEAIYDAVAREGVTHFGGAPIVLNVIVNADRAGPSPVRPYRRSVRPGRRRPFDALRHGRLRLPCRAGLRPDRGVWAGGRKHMERGMGRAVRIRARRKEGPDGRGDAYDGRAVCRRSRNDGAGAARRPDVGRNPDTRKRYDEGLFEGIRSDGRRVPEWLAAYRRHRGPPSRRLRADRGPREGYHHFGRREVSSVEVEGRPDASSRGFALRRRRQGRRKVGRGALCLCRN